MRQRTCSLRLPPYSFEAYDDGTLVFARDGEIFATFTLPREPVIQNHVSIQNATGPVAVGSTVGRQEAYTTNARVESITQHASTIAEAGNIALAQALRHLAEEIRVSRELTDTLRSDAMDLLAKLSQQAALPSTSRDNPGTLKAIFKGLATTVQTAGGAAEVFQAWEKLKALVEPLVGPLSGL